MRLCFIFTRGAGDRIPAKKTPIPIEEVTQQNVTKPKNKKNLEIWSPSKCGKLFKDQKKCISPQTALKTIVHLDLYFLAKLNTFNTKNTDEPHKLNPSFSFEEASLIP